LAATPNTNPYSNDGTEGFIYCVWHDVIVYPMFAGKHVSNRRAGQPAPGRFALGLWIENAGNWLGARFQQQARIVGNSGIVCGCLRIHTLCLRPMGRAAHGGT